MRKLSITLDKATVDSSRHTMPLKRTIALPKGHGGKAVEKKPATSPKAKAAVTAVVEWDLQLYVAGSTPRSAVALRNLEMLCNRHLAGRYRIEIVDLTKNPQRGQADQILYLPTLVRKGSFPIRKIIGNLSDTKRVLTSLGIEGPRS